MDVNLMNVDFVLLGFVLCSAMLISGFVIYVWTNDEENKK
jgi:hypothetical protein